jgi:hypothetical protein
MSIILGEAQTNKADPNPLRIRDHNSPAVPDGCRDQRHVAISKLRRPSRQRLPASGTGRGHIGGGCPVLREAVAASRDTAGVGGAGVVLFIIAMIGSY